jgi:hypothetical protein
MSFYLSRLLGMDSVPAVFLAITNQTSVHWRNVDISSVEWNLIIAVKIKLSIANNLIPKVFRIDRFCTYI